MDKENGLIVFTHILLAILLFLCFLLLSVPGLILLLFFLPRELHLTTHLEQLFWGQIILVVFLKLFWFSLHPKSVVLLGMGFWVKRFFFFFSHYPLFLVSMFFLRNQLLFNFPLKINMSFLSAVLRIFFITDFRSVIMIHLRMDSLELTLVGFTHLPKSVGLIPLLNMENIQLLFLGKLFQHNSLYPLLWDLIMWIS